MTVKTSVSMRDDHHAFAEDLVRRGRFASVSAVVQFGLERMREEEQAVREEREALVEMLKERAAGPFLSSQEFDVEMERMFAEMRREYGLEG